MKSCWLWGLFCVLLGASTVYAQLSVEDALARLKDKQKGHPPTQPTTTATQPDAEAVVATTQKVTISDERYPNGELKSRYSVTAAGVKSGPYSLFTDDGKRVEHGMYRDGEREGTRQTFFANGKVKLQDNYRKGQRDGALIEYDEKGNILQSGDYKGGEPTHISEFKDGLPISDKTYVAGMLVYPRSTAMIVSELGRIEKMKIEMGKSAEPVPVHEGGNDSAKDRDEAVRLLMQYRYLSYVPYEGLSLDPVYCAHNEAAAGILSAIGKLSHTPPNPGWPADRYKFAFEGTSHSNVYMSGGNPAALCVQSVNAYMEDSDSSNIDRLGHRRWCLNPRMGKVGFASFKGYSSMWSFDGSRAETPDFDFISYPAAGYYPSTHFGTRNAWSVTVNEGKYARPSDKSVKVSVTPVKVQVTQNTIMPTGKALEFDYNGVNLAGFGISNCIIFRPVGVKTNPGTAYLVEITGLQARDGKPATIKYVVEFFKPAVG